MVTPFLFVKFFLITIEGLWDKVISVKLVLKIEMESNLFVKW
ncbi:hypothetical protein BALU111458_25220 [Bacillus luti]